MKPQVYISRIIRSLDDSLGNISMIPPTSLSDKHSEMLRVSKNYVKKASKKIKELQRDLPVR